MSALKRLAISVGDLNGVGFEIALKAHDKIKQLCEPLYCINYTMAHQAAALLHKQIPNDFHMFKVSGEFTIEAGKISASSGRYSYDSFIAAVELAKANHVDAIVTLPIHKEAWMMAGIDYVGHTDALRDILKSDAIMMLGCDKLYVPLYTEHIPLREVASHIQTDKLLTFFLQLYHATSHEPIAVLGLNPHAGDHGVLGDEERFIEAAIEHANKELGREVFIGPIVPDIAFTPRFRERYSMIAAMYHDQGLAPLKALYFDEGINVSLGLPIIRTSVDHGTAFDIAYQNKASVLSYINAVTAAVKLISPKGDEF
ncbi:MAG: 4-hydroxythreonine-4-phosphate dehydrogenase PdxA [Sulfuricurvum sp. RIFOXYD2_FULL_44_160]|uniref:4-hydroxythreonine-4-phosphate dehydrogenase n=1 Tax=Sulfuricurvum kujiense TaxID=148813 RepID=A0A2D3WF96_9BACT|nr:MULTISPECIES: 4-hydroxythreonine-4-phosphate dehydrogenase [Sulfuricurvum]OHD92663.1 MAG: 4-hydroxythreonine-4-phosphate dehydrogenase PdxA [Sulfuricurvum sp. RIFOXYD12_FULL_44_77]OHD93616.1 MAG: 4-hydroxythreonine-4-phosphate dehydrogenase PdxA [Sulfuricurvum sp. RIFOXYD2_FULL_44_160]DAB37760.1 MAG TPA: 4-hydroxythreonine-4-phosphate dehydrogenase PdxA [Sulfuricurvum kujiense]